MKSTNERVYDILEKAKRLKVKKRVIKFTSIILSIVTVVTAWNMILFLPYPQQRDNLKQYKNSEYYSIMQTVDGFVTPVVDKHDGYKNNHEKWTGNFKKGIHNGFQSIWDGIKSLWPFKSKSNADDGNTTPSPDNNGSPSGGADCQVDSAFAGDLFKSNSRYIFHLRSGLSSNDALGTTYSASGSYSGNGYVLCVYEMKQSDTVRVGRYEIKPEDGMQFSMSGAEMHLSEDGNTVTVVTQSVTEDNRIYTTAISLNVSNVQNIAERNRQYVSGKFTTSRMIDDDLLLVSSFQVKESPNYRKQKDYLPQVGALDSLTSIPADDIHLPEYTQSATYTVVTAMDFATLATHDTHAFLAYSDSVYVSDNKVYATTSYTKKEDLGKRHEYLDMTDISCLAYNGESIQLLGTVSVEGIVKDAYSMDEFNGHLRVFTATHVSVYEETVRGDNVSVRWVKNESSANLYAIGLSNFKVSASKENFIAIGETMRTVCFDGNKAYASTAATVELTTPVFAFDLTNASTITVSNNAQGYPFSLTKFTGGTLLGFSYDENNHFKVNVYQETAGTVQSVASYQISNASIAQNGKAYFVNAENGYIGLFNATANKYVMLRFDGTQITECFTQSFRSNATDIRAYLADGWAYVLGSNGLKAYSLS